MNRCTCTIFVILLSISFLIRIRCDSNNLEFDLDKLKEQLPKNLELPASFQNMPLPSVDEVKRLLKDKCAKTSGGDAAYEAIERGAEELKTCTSGLIDVDQLQNEIHEAEPKGELDTVFNKYCRKRDIATGCLETFTALLEPCLQPNELEGKRTIVNMVKKFLNFVCHRDGDHIALFIAEKGPQCFDSRKDDLINCVNATFAEHIPSDISTITLPTALPEFAIGPKQCE